MKNVSIPLPSVMMLLGSELTRTGRLCNEMMLRGREWREEV